MVKRKKGMTISEDRTGFWPTMQEFIPNLRDQQVSSSLRKLVVFSFSIIAIPLASMFAFKRIVFEGIFGLNNSDSLLYSAIIAVVLVHVVLFIFVYFAWKDDQPLEPRRLTKEEIAAEKID